MKIRHLVSIFLATSPLASGFELINVNFNGFSGGNTGPAEQVESTLEGPAGGLGTSWNQFADNSSSGIMFDSTGANTNVTVTTDFSEGRYDGPGPDLTTLRAALTDFGRGAGRTVTIGGLEADEVYDVWLVSHRHQGGAAERQKGTWTSVNSTSSSATQLVDGTKGALNGASFVAGVNYALFANVAADESGEIVFNGKGATEADGFDADYRLHLNGIQIAPAAPVVPPEPLEFTDFVFSPDADEVTLTWKSNVGETYGLYWSTDLETFHIHSVHHAIPAHPSEKRTTLGPISSPVPDADRLFFLVGPPDLSEPVLAQSFGSGNTVTLRFSEEIHPDSVSDPGNFSVSLDGGAIGILSAVLGDGGEDIVLTLDGTLAAGTEYGVVAENITTLAGRVIPVTFSDSLQTWDDDPDGVQVFILAGQSNMVGHGKTERGHDSDGDGQEDPGGIGSLRHLAVNDAAYPDVDYSRLLVDPAQPATSAWKARDDVKIWWRDSDVGAARTVKKGDLTNGYGQSPSWYGPEYGFGWALGDHFTDKPVLIVKVAWGGKS